MQPTHIPGSPQAGTNTPLARFLRETHARIAVDHSGSVADYIPELGKANPAHFGLALATLDGYVYASGDADVPFTIQSISKAFVFALALEILGNDAVEAAIGVEPSGEAFNSVRLTSDNRPFNAMVNSGAIACAAMIRDAEGPSAWDRVAGALGAFAGRTLVLDDAVFRSESDTGDRNRAIAYLLRNAGRFRCGVEEALDVYFRQCSLLVTARDLAVMAATLANGGLNPVTGVQVVSAGTVSRTMSVMATSGMYDYAGEWIYRVGLPAKSGVGGGIIAAMPGQLGLGSFSPPLDKHGNSVRGLKACEALSSFYSLHMLNPARGASRCILADYQGDATRSRRERRAKEMQFLSSERAGVRVLELYGTLSFNDVDYIARRLDGGSSRMTALVLDLHRAAGTTVAGAKLFDELIARSIGDGVLVAVVDLAGEKTAPAAPKHFLALEDALEWVEDTFLSRRPEHLRADHDTELSEQALLSGMSPGEIDAVREVGFLRRVSFESRIIHAGEPGASTFFLLSGTVSVRLPGGRRLATLAAGACFGEMALLHQDRSADVVADVDASIFELPNSALAGLRTSWPEIEPRLMRNLAMILADRLRQTNAKLQLLRA